MIIHPYPRKPICHSEQNPIKKKKTKCKINRNQNKCCKKCESKEEDNNLGYEINKTHEHHPNEKWVERKRENGVKDLPAERDGVLELVGYVSEPS